MKITTFKLTYSIVVKSDGFETEPFMILHSTSAKIMQNCQINSSLFAWKIKQLDDIGKVHLWINGQIRAQTQDVVIILLHVV